MKLSLFILSALGSTFCYAQSNGLKNSSPVMPGDKVKSTYKGAGVIDIDQLAQTKELPRLNRFKEDDPLVAEEQKKINEMRSQANDNCERDEIRVRQLDLDFYKKYEKQITEINDKVKKGLKKQAEILNGYREGKVEGIPSEEFNFNGKTESSAMIEFSDEDQDRNPITVRVPVKNLIRFIFKFEEEASHIKSNDDVAIDALLKKYNAPENARDPAYFNLTLDQATRAYAGNPTGCLDSAFKISYRQEQERELFVGSGKDQFRVSSYTILKQLKVYDNKDDPTQFHTVSVGTLLRRDLQNQNNGKVTLSENFTEAFKEANEDRYWEVVRAQQLTLDGIPIDGLQRRIFYDQTRRYDCPQYTFNEKSPPGPFLPYDQKTTCTKVGFDLLSAALTKTGNYNGRAAVGSTFNLTEGLKAEIDGRQRISARNGFHNLVVSSGIGNCDYVSLHMTYRCGCERVPRTYDKAYKMDQGISLSCD